MVAGAGGVCVVGVQQAAALRGPPATTRDARRVPEGTVGAEVVVKLWRRRANRRRKETNTHERFFRTGVGLVTCEVTSPTQTCRCLRVKITGSER